MSQITCLICHKILDFELFSNGKPICNICWWDPDNMAAVRDAQANPALSLRSVAHSRTPTTDQRNPTLTLPIVDSSVRFDSAQPEPGANMRRAQIDAERLYGVADGIYKALIIFNWILAIFGLIGAIFSFVAAANVNSSGPAFLGIGFLLATVFICLINYAVAVLSTHFAKVLSNISLSLLGAPR